MTIDYIVIPAGFLSLDVCDKAKMLLGLIYSFSAKDKALMMSNSQIGELLNIRPDHTSRIVQELHKEKLIKITGGRSKYRKIYFAENAKVKDFYFAEKRKILCGKTQDTLRKMPNKTKRTKKNLKEYTYRPNSDEFRLAELLLSEILNRKPDFKKPNIQAWSKHIDRMIRLDHRKPSAIEDVIRFCQRDDFWQNVVLSTSKLREQFDKLELKMKKAAPEQKLPAYLRPIRTEAI